jgi:hypothetical protein
MTFQVLDAKKECVGFYEDGKLQFRNFQPKSKTTWSYSPTLDGSDIEYAYIYANGATLDECCPEQLKLEWQKSNNKIKSFINSFFESKVDLNQNCIFDLIPERYLKEFYETKNKITDHVIATKEKPAEYEFYKRFLKLASDISSRKLQLDRSWLSEKLYDVQAKKLWEKINNSKTSINYNMFGSITGRLTVSEDSFPILNLNKNLRNVIRPTNDWFVEFDLNAAELRVALALLNKQQIAGDLHEWSVQNIFNNELTRSEAKQTATSWLYNSHNKLALKYDKELNAFYNKQALESIYWVDGMVHTPFNRRIEADKHHVISYLNQSTLIDLFHRQILKVDDLLKNNKSFIAFMVHDSVVLDLSDAEKNLLPLIVKALSDTAWGEFPVNIKIGQNYGNMKKVTLKA